MDSKGKYNQKKLLDDVDSILDEINSTVKEDEKLIKSLESEPQKSSSFVSDEELLLSFIPSDGHIDLKVSKDKLKVTATLYPPTEGGSPVSVQMLRNEIEKEGIKGRYNPENLIDSILTCNFEKKIIYDLEIMEGLVPVDSYSQEVVLAKNIRGQYDSFREDDMSQVNFKNFSQFIIVKPNDFIGELKPEQDGRNGLDVYGNIIPFKKIKSNSPKIGKNLVVSQGFICSTIEGRLIITEKNIYVDEVLIVDKNVDYHTGNITFPKDIIVRGEVADGFTINAGGSILFEKVLDATNVNCKGDLTVHYGIIGKRTSLVKTGGNLKASFIEHCKIYASGNVTVTKSILNSEIYSGNTIEMTKYGIIKGGVLYSTNGLRTFELGSQSETLTEVFCGIDYIVQKKLEWIRDQNTKLLGQFKKINLEIDRQVSQELTDLKEKRDLILKTMSHLQENAKRLVAHLDRNEDADVVVTGTVYPGVYIEICHVSFHVYKEMKHVRFYLDKSQGKVISEKIKK